jgi:hypothetical protein
MMASANSEGNALVTGLGVAAVVAAIYAVHLPTVAAARASAPGNTHIESSRKSATWTGAAVVVGASVLGKLGAGNGFASTVFIIGGSVVVGLDVAHRLANSTDNKTGKLAAAPAMDATAAGAGTGS